ncbi:MAG: SRPBCC domain-containing protein [Acidobacteriota bacterium]|nr:SRPBCC domain-containing protein [Acidobacteriota bacterium]
MTSDGMVHNTFQIERTYPQPPARVYAAFAQPEKKRKWYADSGQEDEAYEMEFKPGGAEFHRYRFKKGHPIAGMTIENRGTFEDIVPDKRIVQTATMKLNGTVISVVLVTLEFNEKDGGTELVCTHQGVFYEGSGGWEMRRQGWEKLFEKLETALSA